LHQYTETLIGSFWGMMQIANFQKIRHQKENPASKINHRKMTIFNCSCGSKILIVPDVPAMNKAIKNHVEQHKLLGKPLTEEKLTREILITLSKSK
jgi:hypothetical protein